MPTQYHTEPVIIEDSETVDSPFSFQKLVVKFFLLWPWLIGSTIVCIGCALFYLHQSPPEFKIHASLLVQDDKKGTEFGDAGLLQDFGLLSGKSNVDNEAEILKSRSLLEQVVEDMQLYVNYFIPERLQSVEVYGNRPVDLHFIRPLGATVFKPVVYTLTLHKTDVTAYALTNGENTYHAHFGDTIQLKEGTVCVTPFTGFSNWPRGQQLAISINHIDPVTQQYLNAVSIDIPNKQVSVIYLTLTHTIREKGESVLNTLLRRYLQGNVDDKNKIADSTIRFIDDRLVLVSGELSGIEKEIEGFKTSNQLTDLSEQSRLMIQNSSDYTRQQTMQEVQLSVVQELENFLKNNQNNSRIVPSSLVMQEPSFLAIIQRYNETQLQRDKLLMSLTPEHPSVISTDEQLRNLRLELFSSISSIKKGVQVGISELKKRNAGFTSQISKVPAKERVFLDFSRQQSIKQELYLFLLKKREETAVSKSSNIANARIIDPAKSEAAPFKPKKSMVVFAGLMAGLLLPFVISFGKDAMSNRIAALKDISNLTRVPILAEIGRNDNNNEIAVTLNSRHRISEQFRSLRTNLKFVLPGKNDKTIMVTSSMEDEGKSFICLNLSMVLALAGKKVILLEMDLRKPDIIGDLHLIRHGFTNYVISNNDDWRKWVQPSGIHKNVDILAGGPVPPNPAELLMMPQTAALFNDLKNVYDYIICDTPPAGLFTDAEIMASYVDATLYIVRQGVTYKNHISMIEKFHQKKAMPRINIIVNEREYKNDVNGYAYHYGEYGKKDK